MGGARALGRVGMATLSAFEARSWQNVKFVHGQGMVGWVGEQALSGYNAYSCVSAGTIPSGGLASVSWAVQMCWYVEKGDRAMLQTRHMRTRWVRLITIE
jgi:hypothetical protein